MSTLTEAAVAWSQESFQQGKELEGAAKSLLVVPAVALDVLGKTAWLAFLILGSSSDIDPLGDDLRDIRDDD